MGKIFDQAIGSDAHIALETTTDGRIELEVSYSVEKLHAPVTSFLQKITAKIPFIQRNVPYFVNGVFSSLGVKLQPAAAVDTGPAAHEAAPIEPAAPQA